MSSSYVKALSPRRTIYNLGKQNFPLSQEQVVKVVDDIIASTPSAFNSQTTRAIVLFGDNQEKLWNGIARDALYAVSGDREGWAQTEQKLQAFGAAYGTVLIFEDDEIIKGMQEKFPRYAEKFPEWAAHTTGAVSIHIWNALALDKIGANLQHYSPLIDAGVAKTWNVPKTWKLTGQLVFGSINEKAKEPTKLQDVVKVFK